MAEMYVSTMRIGVSAESEVDANIILDSLREIMMVTLDENDGDFVVITQIIPFSQHRKRTPQELCDILRRDRNILLATKTTQGWEFARELDKTIHMLMTGGDELIAYNYGNFLELAEKILQGENPVD